MASAGVGELTVLAELFHWVLDRYRPASVAVLGVAGGNGLEQLIVQPRRESLEWTSTSSISMKSNVGSARFQGWNFTATILPNETAVLLPWRWYMQH